MVDGGGVHNEHAGQPLSQEKVIANLAVFFAQLPSAFDAHLEELLVHYLLVNGQHALRLESLHTHTQYPHMARERLLEESGS